MESHRHQGKPDITQIIINGNLTEAEVQRKQKVFPKTSITNSQTMTKV